MSPLFGSLRVLLSLKNISLNLGRTALLDNANLTLEPGERLCLMGCNGAGKSTLLKVIVGEVKVDGGEIITAAQGLRVTQLPQDVPRDHKPLTLALSPSRKDAMGRGKPSTWWPIRPLAH